MNGTAWTEVNDNLSKEVIVHLGAELQTAAVL